MNNGERPAMLSDIKELKDAVEERFGRIEANIHKVSVGLSRAEGRAVDFKREILDMLTEWSSRIMNMIDGLSGQYVKLDRRQILTSSDLDAIRVRVDHWEKKP